MHSFIQKSLIKNLKYARHPLAHRWEMPVRELDLAAVFIRTIVRYQVTHLDWALRSFMKGLFAEVRG